MATCATCGSTILFGGARDGELRYCSQKCRGSSVLVQLAQRIPADAVRQAAEQVYRGRCPRCGGSGPVDLHVSYRVVSMLVVTRWSSVPTICCARCGLRKRLLDTLYSLVLGWWGFPWGLLVTPIQVIRNLAGLSLSRRGIQRPSPQLEHAVRLRLAAQAAQNAQIARTRSA